MNKRRKGKFIRRRLVCGLLLLVVAGGLLQPWCHRAICYVGQQLYPLKYNQQVEEYAQEFALDPLLVTAFIRVESGFDPEACSTAEAHGLMQITEETYSWVHSKLEPDSLWDYDRMYDPAYNIRYGCYFLAYCLQRYGGDLATAAAAYNGGCGTVDRLLTETAYSADGRTLTVFPYRNMNHYVEKITSCYQRYLSLYAETGVAQ